MNKIKVVLFLSAFILSASALGWLRLANMPEEIIKRSLDGFKAVEAVDEVKVVAPLNQFAHSDLFTAESDADFAGFTFPIADLLYSIAWLDLSEEPIIISVPKMGERYYAICFTDLLNRNSGYIGTRVTGGEQGRFAIVSPSWEGDLPEGITRFEVSTPQVNAFIRTFVDGPEDLDTADALRRQVTLTPLSQL